MESKQRLSRGSTRPAQQAPIVLAPKEEVNLQKEKTRSQRVSGSTTWHWVESPGVLDPQVVYRWLEKAGPLSCVDQPTPVLRTQLGSPRSKVCSKHRKMEGNCLARALLNALHSQHLSILFYGLLDCERRVRSAALHISLTNYPETIFWRLRF